MSKLLTLLVFASAAGLAAYGVHEPVQQTAPARHTARPVTPAITPSPNIPIRAELPNPALATRPALPRAAAMFLQPGSLFLSQPAPSPLGVVTLSPNPNIGGSGQSGYTGIGGGYAWAAYAWHIPYHLVPFEPDDAMVFLEAWTDPSFAGFTPGSLGGPRLRLYMATNKITASSVLVQNMVGFNGLGGLTTISP